MQFLNSFPKNLGALTHPLNQKVETEKEDDIKLWNQIYDSVQDYLLDCGLLKLQQRKSYQSNINGKYRAFNVQVINSTIA